MTVYITAMKHIQLPQDQCAALVEDRKQGMSAQELAHKYGVSRGSVLRILNRAGIVRPGLKLDARIDEVLAAYRSGTRLTELAEQFDCDIATVRSALERNGVEIPRSWSRSRSTGLFGLSADQVNELKEAYQTGATSTELAARYGVTASCVCNTLRRNGVEIRKAGTNLASREVDRRAAKYGITVGQLQNLLETQSTCQICGASASSPSNNGCESLSIDHDHETGAVRGALCASCNSAIGLLRDNAEIIERAAAYLRAVKGRTDNTWLLEKKPDGSLAPVTPESLLQPTVAEPAVQHKTRDEYHAKIREMYESGRTLVEIAQVYNTNHVTIRRHLLALGVEMRPKGYTGPRPHQIALSQEDELQAVELAKAKTSMSHIAEKLGVSPPTIKRCLQRHGVWNPRFAAEFDQLPPAPGPQAVSISG